MVLAYHFEKVAPKETKRTLPRKAGTQYLALTSDNQHAFSK
jgi:hypothetical protein